MGKQEESQQNNLAIVEYFAELCDKKKIVWLNDTHRKDRSTTPDFVRNKYFGGQLKNILNSDHALGKNLRCLGVELGEIKKSSIIVFNTKNEKYVKKCITNFKKLKNELTRLDKQYDFDRDYLKRKMLKIGGRYDV